MGGWGTGGYGSGTYGDFTGDEGVGALSTLGDGLVGTGTLGDPLELAPPKQPPVQVGPRFLLEATVEDDVTGEVMRLYPTTTDFGDEFWLTHLNFGFPSVRESVVDRADDHGTQDRTQYMGARTITVGGWTESHVTAARLAEWFDPSRRVFLRWTLGGEGFRRQAQVRGSDLAAPLVRIEDRTAITVDGQWRCPSGRLESAALHRVVLLPEQPEEGAEWDWVWDVDWGGGSGRGTATITNRGSLPAGLFLRVFGPCTAPRVENITTGEVLNFNGPADPGLEVADGEWLEVDTVAHRALLNGLRDLSKAGSLDFAAVSPRWMRLNKGANVLRFAPAEFARPCQLEVLWRDAWLT